MTADEVLMRARALCRRMRVLTGPAALGLCIGLSGCAQETDFGDDACSDGRDNDHDGDIDCADEDCWEEGMCVFAEYMAPFEG